MDYRVVKNHKFKWKMVAAMIILKIASHKVLKHLEIKFIDGSSYDYNKNCNSTYNQKPIPGKSWDLPRNHKCRRFVVR